MKFRVTAILAALAIVTSFSANAQTLYVDDVAGGAADCSTTGDRCTLDVALDITGGSYASFIAGVTLDLAAGTYTLYDIPGVGTGVPIALDEDLVTLVGANAGVAHDGARGLETILDASDIAYAISIEAEFITIDGVEIVGDADGGAGTEVTWTGIHVSGDYDNWTVENSLIHDIGAKNPGSSTYNYAYGIWSLGGGSSGAREDISGVEISENAIYDLGGEALGGFEVSSGAGIWLFSIVGTDYTKCAAATILDCGAWIHDNYIYDLNEGKNSLRTGSPVNDPTGKEPTVAITVGQDDDEDRFNRSVLIEDNTYGDGAPTLDGGIVIETGDSRIEEDNSNFTVTTVYVLNIDRKASVDEAALATFYKSLNPDVYGPGTDAYFSAEADAIANSDDDATIVTLTGAAGELNLIIDEGGDAGSVKVNLDSAGDLNVREGARLLYDGSLTVIDQIEVVGTSGNDFLTIDFNNGNPLPDGDTVACSGAGVATCGIDYQASGGYDKIILRGDEQLTDQAIVMLDSDSGDIIFEPTTTSPPTTYTSGTSTVVHFDDLEPIDDLIIVNGSYTIVAPGAVDNEINIIDGPFIFGEQTFQVNSGAVPTFELVNFANKKTVEVQGADTGDDIFTVFTTDGEEPDLILSLTLDGDPGAGTSDDVFIVRPSTDYPITVDGGGETAAEDFFFLDCANISVTCPSAPVVADEDGPGGTTGSESGMTGYETVTWDDIENVGMTLTASEDLVLDKTITDFPDGAHPGDDITFTITLSHDSGSTIVEDTLYVTDVIDYRLSLIDQSVLVSRGTILENNTWRIPASAGDPFDTADTATLVYKVILNTVLTDSIPNFATLLNPDADDSNSSDSDTLAVLDIFPFPAKAPIQATLFYQAEAGPRYIAGLFGGAVDPRQPGAVLCRVPEANPSVGWDGALGNQWYSCHDGLPSNGDTPMPLVVTDLYEDSAGRIWLTSWGNDGLYYSENGGKSWTSADPDLTGGPGGLPDGTADGFAQIYAITEDILGTLYISANNGDTYRSHDRGVTWKQGAQLPAGSADTAWSLEADPTTPGTVYAGTFGDSMFVTPGDFGFTWVKPAGTGLDPGAGYIFDLEFDPITGELFAGTAKGLFHSADGGENWSGLNFSFPFPTNPPEIRHIAFDENGALYVATWGFGVWASTNWQATSLAEFALKNQYVMDIAVSGGKLVAGTSGPNIFSFPALAVSTGTEDEYSPEVPSDYTLSQNYPNPFNPTTTIEFGLPGADDVRLAVYDVLGRRVALLVEGPMAAGQHRVSFEAHDLPSGMYLYRLQTPTGVITQKMILMK